MSIMSRRFAAVEDTIAQVRASEAHYGVSPTALAQIKGALIDLARRDDLFPPDEFTIPEGAPARLYRLAEDLERRFIHLSARVVRSKTTGEQAIEATHADVVKRLGLG